MVGASYPHVSATQIEWIPAASAIFARSIRSLRLKFSDQFREIASFRAIFYYLLVSLNSDLRHAAIYEEVGAGDVTALVRREENHRVSDLVRGPDATAWCRGGHAFLDLIDLSVAQAPILVAGRDDRTGTHHVDADSATLEIHRPSPRERPQR